MEKINLNQQDGTELGSIDKVEILEVAIEALEERLMPICLCQTIWE